MSQTFFGLRLRSLSVASAALFVVAMYAATASAALLVYDPFRHNGGPASYDVGVDGASDDGGLQPKNPIGSSNQFAPFPGYDPATGPGFYAGGWVQSGNAVQVVEKGTLRYPFFPVTGGRATDDPLYGCCTFGRNGRPLAGFGLGSGRSARTIYQSFLVDFGGLGTDTDNGNIGKHGYEMWNGGIDDSLLAVEVYVNHYSGDTDLTLGVTTPGGGNQKQVLAGNQDLVDLAGTNAGTHLVVLKFELGVPVDDGMGGTLDPLTTTADDDIVSVYLDPTDSVEANWTPAASIAVNASDLVITHHGLHAHFQFTGGAHIPGSIDELRWGDTFADVTPFIPEPTSFSLMGLSLAGLLLGRRR